MTFLTPLLLAGAGLIVIPIILHLIMRQRPKLLEFPALRFLQERHQANQRRLLLQHILLLLLRAGAIALLALALARPSVKFSSRLGRQEEPVAAALIFDSAPHMGYRHEKKTRLDAAREIGTWLLTQLPPESQTAVFDSGAAPRRLDDHSFDADRGLSQQRIDRLDFVPNPRTLGDIVGEAALVLKSSKLPTKEIYVFTDLAQASWRSDETTQLQDRLRELPGVALYLIDVGVPQASNFGLGDLRVSPQVVAAGGSVEIRTDISCVGGEGERVVELELLSPEGQPQKIGEQPHRLKSGESQAVDFRLPPLKPGIHQGRVRIVPEDSLPADDVRYFSVAVRPPWPVLVVAPQPTTDSAIYLTEAIAPAEMRARHNERFQCRVIDYREFGEVVGKGLEPYAAVCLLDPPGLEPGVWERLTDYAAAGHGVGIFLGRQALPIEAFNGAAAQKCLPGQIKEQVPREDGNTYLAPQNYQHPVLKPFAPLATRTPWKMFPVYRYWRIDAGTEGSTVIAYSDGRPALLERTIGTGRVAGHVLVMTTPFSDRVSRRDAWNVLPGSSEMGAWPFVILANQIMSYLVGSGEQQLNYCAGTNSVVLPIDNATPRYYTLARPDGGKTALSPPEKAELSISVVEQVGNYQVYGAGEAGEPAQGFSVNLPAQVTQLARMSEQELSDIFGPFKPQVARSNDQIVRNVHESRVGQEIYPWLIVAFAVLLAVEYVVSNLFYKRT